ncbi:MAG: chemotaxis protein CheD [Gemmatimonadota bacterium]
MTSKTDKRPSGTSSGVSSGISSTPAMQINVGIADYAVGDDGVTLATIGLGSCVAIALHSRRARIGALAHVLLPNAALSGGADTPGKFASTALPVMLRRMRELGVTDDVEARLVGGSSMFTALLAPGAPSLGSRNVAAARASCAEHGVTIVAEDVGGAHGRSVYFDVAAGTVLVHSIQMGDVSL